MAMPRQQEHVDPGVVHEDRAVRHEAAGRHMVAASAGPGLGLLGLLVVLLGAWGGIVPFVGPLFGFRSTHSGSFAWTAPHVFLYLIPGAVAMFFGLVLMGAAMERRARFSVSKELAGLVIMACGAWFVLGPVVWPIFSSSAVFGSVTGAQARFVNFLGYNLGPGLLLAAFGAMALVRPVARGYLISPAAPTTVSRA
ncbi:MAG: hypothetical protein J2O39_08495 [Acidimicrobiales bacterium]|nr:hypothetical protein [Acidimicrobiales bacterium]MBO0894403.1 hypothetical protein [Acidimicrobiales bacterium]